MPSCSQSLDCTGTLDNRMVRQRWTIDEHRVAGGIEKSGRLLRDRRVNWPAYFGVSREG